MSYLFLQEIPYNLYGPAKSNASKYLLDKNFNLEADINMNALPEFRYLKVENHNWINEKRKNRTK